MKRRLTMAVDDFCTRKLVHVIPFEDDAAGVIEPATKRVKSSSSRKSPGSLTSLEEEGLQALLTLSSPIKPLMLQVNHTHETDVHRSSEPTKTNATVVVSKFSSSIKTPDLLLIQRGTSPSNKRIFISGIMIQPVLPPPPLRYLGRPLGLPPPLPRIPYGCVFSNRETIKKPHI
jgi:hypothetical protein